jgi:hypothetical protein
VQRSVRLRSSASANFSRTFTTPTNQAKWTWSGWIKRGSLGSVQRLLSSGTTTSDTTTTTVYFPTADTIGFTGGTTIFRSSNQVFRDPSAWYHIVIAVDTTQAVEANKILIYVNGLPITFATTNAITTCAFNSAQTAYIGQFTSTQYFDGYLTEVNFIDGQALTPTSFGSINSSTGVWQPIKYSGTYGTNGFYLNFQDNSGATATTIGKDSSGNGNNWTPNNISVTAGVTYDSMTDVPTLTSGSNANFAVLNPLDLFVGAGGSPAISNGNLRITTSATANSQNGIYSSIAVTSGQWYFETTITTAGAANQNTSIGMFGAAHTSSAISSNHVYLAGYVSPATSSIVKNGSSVQTGLASIVSGDVIGVAFDATNLTCQVYRNGSAFGSQVTGITADNYEALIYGLTSSGGVQWVFDGNFGQRPFSYTPPTGFKSLNTYNLPDSTIPNGATQFAATTYTGTGSSLAISNTVNGKSFTPDFVWVKGRSGATDHALYDSVRGTTKQLESNTNTAETTEATGLTAFDSSGFTVGALAQMNTNAATYVGWQWKAGGAAVTNTSGSISSQVSSNPSAGFSIVTYTGTGTNGATVGHGLGVVPKMIIVKPRSTVSGWSVFHTSLSANNGLALQSTNAQFTAASTVSGILSTSPTSTTFGFVSGSSNADNVNKNTVPMVAYCFSEIAGFSKFGSYTGNGSTNGPFIYTGFRPRFILYKNAIGEVTNWLIMDTSRTTRNVVGDYLLPNSSAAEANLALVDILSNGFKFRTNAVGNNTNGATYIYAAFAENPFKNALAR